MGATEGTAPATERRAPAPEMPVRLASLDAYRGFIMLVLASGGFALAKVAAGFPASGFWSFIEHEFGHAPWEGCTFWDLIQPSFMFMVGVAMPFSFASRRARGHSTARIAGHVVKRAVVLSLLGILLMSNWSDRTQWTFVNVLTQIGLGYAFVALLVGRGPAVQLLAIAAVLGGTWYAFYQHPLPGPGFDFKAAGIPDDWARFTGLFAHWNKHVNWAGAFDRRFLSLFPPYDFTHNAGGYQTLNFIPSIATMAFGVMAGELLRGWRTPREKFGRLVAAGVLCLGIGFGLGRTVCPIVKRIWTPSWTIYAGGWTLLLLAGFYGIIDLAGRKRWAFPLTVVGMNSLTIYLMANLSKPWIRKTLHIHFGGALYERTYGPIAESVAVLAVMWLALYWMVRRKYFIRV